MKIYALSVIVIMSIALSSCQKNSIKNENPTEKSDVIQSEIDSQLNSEPSLIQPASVVIPFTEKKQSQFFKNAPVFTTVEEKEHQIPIYYLETIKKNYGTRDQFALTLGNRLNELTEESGYENCAAICVSKRNSNQWSAILTTTKSHSVCVVIDVCEEGYKLSNSDIHSHINTSVYKPNEIDKVFLEKDYGENDLVVTMPNGFSKHDYIRTGYMVNKQGLWFQSGKGQERTIKLFN